MISPEQFERASRNPHFDFRSLLHILFPFPPTGSDMRRKKWEVSSLVAIPCHFIIFGGLSGPPRIYESQTSKILVPDLELAERTFRARVYIKK